MIKRKSALPCDRALRVGWLFRLPGPCSVAPGRAGARGRIIIQGTHEVYRAVGMRCRVHRRLTIASAVTGAAGKPLRCDVIRVLASRRRDGVARTACRSRRNVGAGLRQDRRSSGAARGRRGQYGPGLRVVGLAGAPGRVRERSAGRDRRDVRAGLRQHRRPSAAGRRR